MPTNLPKGPYTLGEFEGNPAYANIYAEGDDVYLGQVSTEDMPLEQAQAVAQRWIDALAWSEPESLDAPDGEGWWWWCRLTDHDVKEWEPLLIADAGDGQFAYYLGPTLYPVGVLVSGQWVKAVPPGPAPHERYRTMVGNLLDHWEQVPNDLKTDPGLENIVRLMDELETATKQRGA